MRVTYLFVLFVFIFANYLIFGYFGIPGLLIVNLSLIIFLLLLILNKMNRTSSAKEKPINEQEVRKRMAEVERSKHDFHEKDLPDPDDIRQATIKD